MITFDRLASPDLTDIPTDELRDAMQSLDHLPAQQREYVSARVSAELKRRSHAIDAHG